MTCVGCASSTSASPAPRARLAAASQNRRGAAWHKRKQYLVDGFETIFSIQIDNAARICKTVRTLITGVLM